MGLREKFIARFLPASQNVAKSRVTLLSVILLLALVFGILGCWNGGGGENPVGPVSPVATGFDNSAAGVAHSVSFRIVLPDQAANNAIPAASLLSSIRASSVASPLVTFKLVLLNVGNVNQPTVTLVKTASADSFGVAEVKFTSVPALPCLGDVSIQGGNISGFYEFHGCTDLASEEENIIEISPKGSRLQSDILAESINQITSSTELFLKATTGLIEKLKSLIAGIGTNNAIDSNQVVEAFKSAPSPRFIRSFDGRITDSSTRLQWLEGKDCAITWNEAQEWIEQLGDNWRAPTRAELEGIYIANSNRVGIKSADGLEGPYYLHLDPAFKLDSSYMVWSSEVKDSITAYGFYFYDGHIGWPGRDDPYWFHRAFAVRTLPISTALTGLALDPSAVSIRQGETYNLANVAAKAIYSDNSSVAVTNVVWSGQGIIGTTFTAPFSDGSLSLLCSYTEAGITKSAEFIFTVQINTSSGNEKRAKQFIAVDWQTGIVLMEDGAVWGTGYNTKGILGAYEYYPPAGFKSVMSYKKFKKINGLENITQIAGHNQDCFIALDGNGRVWALGSNKLGVMGLGTTDSEDHPIPSQIPGLNDIVYISSEASFHLAVDKYGSVFRWGYDHYSNKAVPPTDLGVADAVKACHINGSEILFIKNDGTVWSWFSSVSARGSYSTWGYFAPQLILTSSQLFSDGFPTGSCARLQQIEGISDAVDLSIGDPVSSPTNSIITRNGEVFLFPVTKTNKIPGTHLFAITPTGEVSRRIMKVTGQFVSVDMAIDQCVYLVNTAGETICFNPLVDEQFVKPGIGPFKFVTRASRLQDAQIGIKQDGSVWVWSDEGGYGFGLGIGLPDSYGGNDGYADSILPAMQVEFSDTYQGDTQ
ncbi:MAG: DUF1566 domain-containing protein [Candidatus Riflebacteria bacterium]|nr:DUF1566 domain-containing protein [Candidatus Riflebacteria bacterium]